MRVEAMEAETIALASASAVISFGREIGERPEGELDAGENAGKGKLRCCWVGIGIGFVWWRYLERCG